MSEAVRDRALGAFIGLAVGNALGTTLEFEVRDAEPPVYDMVGGGPFDLKAGQWTDDTAMALCLAESQIACDGLDERDLMERFCRWYQAGENSCTGRCFDIVMTTRNALEQFRRTDDPIAGPTDARTGGNGSIMRLAPVALRYWNDPERLKDASRRQSYTTHTVRPKPWTPVKPSRPSLPLS
ncbi:ADP-ribosylglycohydrolase family protein [Methylobacterium sp. PvR107]|uniref:ADP-ribosylglycohydrolase family protein n=1 Tax=Methylobacterium sp. PvR107 TaxID=2806597 RepID=UPI0028AE9FE2|nr:ADP-ribosylglycohydrolase family protein [Methylobacterium sp. PvR107]